MPYYLEHGERFPVDATPLGKGLTAHVIQTRQPLVINENLMERAAELGSQDDRRLQHRSRGHDQLRRRPHPEG